MITKFDARDKSIKSYALRKLTPSECFRLMGVSDETIRIMQASRQQYMERVKNAVPCKRWHSNMDDMAVSSWQQRKMSGNSIVVDVLTAIYEQLWYTPDSPQNPEEEKVVLTTFSGYDSQLLACDALKAKHPDFSYTCVGWSDIDKYACQMHNLIYPQFVDKALGDITKVDWLKVKEDLQGKEVDLFTYSSPCQDISIAGKQMGLNEGSGTRSALLWDVAKAIEILRPKYLLQENVAALVSRQFMPDFQKWLNRLESLGYVNVYAKLNARDYGIPQNRDRVFCLSMRKDMSFNFKFPAPKPLTRYMEDILEKDIDEKFFMNNETVKKYLKYEDSESDSVLFVDFDISPSRESAMFLKTWWQLCLEALKAWKNTVTLKEIIEQHKSAFYAVYERWNTYSEFPSDKFKREFDVNMKRGKTYEK